MEDQELTQAFVAETEEAIEDAEPLLIELQQHVEEAGHIDIETINAIFRVFHSTKGSAGFLQLQNICNITHEAETLLDMLRKEKITFSSVHTDLLIQSCDMISEMVTMVSETGTDHIEPARLQQQVDALHACIEGNTADNGTTAAPPSPKQPSTAHAPAEKKPLQHIPPMNREMSAMVSPDMINIFVQDADELLEKAEHALLKISKNPADCHAQVEEVLRAVHTFKGNSGLLGLPQLEALSHHMETVLQCVRDGEMDITEYHLKIMFSLIDVFRKVNESLREGDASNIQGFMGLMELLEEMIPGQSPEAEASQEAASARTPGAAPAPTAPPAEPGKPAQAPSPTPPPPRDTKPSTPPPGSGEALKKPAAAAAKTTARRDIRVNVDKLDILHNLVGELVIAEAMVTRNEDIRSLKLETFERAAHHLNLITSELQDVAMSLRMVPLSGVFRKMIRLVHDLSNKAGKKIDLQLVGEETEVDRNVVELISDPLVHLIRNSVDHGLEPPDERKQAGKEETGTLTIEAKHQSGEVWIIVRDNGRGLNRDKIIARARDRGLFDGNDAKLRDDEVFAFIFQPGFSTAEKVTDISGRGVGMDVVKRNIEKLKGHIEVDSTPGTGTAITIRIPLTLAIIQGMLLRAGRERYVIPMLNIRESFRPDKRDVSSVTGKGEIITIRGELLPFFRLASLFDIENAAMHPEDGIVVVIEDGNDRTALLVDELLGQQQVVIKSLQNVGGNIRGISGACILNDGCVGLILDSRGIIHLAIHESQEAVV